MNDVERKRKFIIDVVYIAILIALFYIFLHYGFGLFMPFVFAFFVAICLQRPVNFIVKKTPLKRGIVSTLLVLLLVFLAITAVSLIGARIVSEFKGFFQFLMSKFENVPDLIIQIKKWFADNLNFLPDTVKTSISDAITNFLNNTFVSAEEVEKSSSSFSVGSLVSPLMSIISSAKQIPFVLVGILVSVITCCFMTSDYPNIRDFILHQFPEEKSKKISQAKHLVFSFLGKMGKAYALILTITFVELVIGLSLLSVMNIYTGGYIVIISLLTAIIDIIPVFGTGSVLIPWAIISFITGNYAQGIGLLVLYAVITVIRQVLEPKLVAGQLGLPPFLTLMAMYIGSQLFGVLGIFLLPLSIITIKALNDEGIIHLYKPMKKKEDATVKIKEGDTKK
ncbi:MAG: sporulation integral membrane protein YtvI [Ruminococcaceae bacterium]|jgi:sporulation integral membrane protein YtvI|nr:sporulation integral membrane protein YtvI [Oscillospiraceae bacterium]